MTRTEAPPLIDAVERPPAEAPSQGWLGTVLVLGALWLILVNQLRLDWSTNAQYSYGWLVPFLTAYLCWLRWPSRPAPEPVSQRWALALGAAGLALAFFPTRLVREATPEWSAVSWALALEVVGLTLIALGAFGGWATLRHFAWPVSFFLVAVAWPVRFESALTQSLMQHLAALTAEIVSWAGVAAIPEGNLIRLSTGVVGVDEACSGVRSLQSMLMASLFLGELNRLGSWQRVALVVAGLGLAVFFNIVRALILISVAVRSGLDAIAEWHDPAGFSILALSFAGLCLVVRLFSKGRAEPAAMPVSKAWLPLPKAWIIGLACWLVFTEAATEAWYRSHETHASDAPGWTVQWPEEQPGFKDRAIAPNVTKMLAYNEGREASWEQADASRWLMFAFRWYPGRSSTVSARLHRPEVCLPASGRTLVKEHPVLWVKAGAVELPFRVYHFDQYGSPLFVFFCLWETGNRDRDVPGLAQDYTRESRLQRVRLGQRNLGQQSIEVIVSGIDSPEKAMAAFQEQMQGVIVPERE